MCCIPAKFRYGRRTRLGGWLSDSNNSIPYFGFPVFSVIWGT
jgi:hypothetical protein